MFANWYAELNFFCLATFTPVNVVSDACKTKSTRCGVHTKKTYVFRSCLKLGTNIRKAQIRTFCKIKQKVGQKEVSLQEIRILLGSLNWYCGEGVCTVRGHTPYKFLLNLNSSYRIMTVCCVL